MRAAGLGSGARLALAAERLRTDDGADHRAVDVEVADRAGLLDRLCGAGDAAVKAHSEAETRRIDPPHRLGKVAALPGRDMQQGAEPFLAQLLDRVDADQGGRNEQPLLRNRDCLENTVLHRLAPPHQLVVGGLVDDRSEEHTSELQSLMRISYAVFCLKKKIKDNRHTNR